MPRLIAVARIRNEDDLIEAFVRHHAALVDRLILLDNDSNDRSMDILRALKAEGLPLTVFHCASTTFVEAAHNTFLFRQAVALGADWVLCLDGDEFIDPRRTPDGLRAHLACVPAAVACLHVDMINYQPTAADDPDEMAVPRRMKWRVTTPNGARKVFVRARLAMQDAILEHGNHNVTLDRKPVPALHDERLVLAHFPMRSGWQMLVKAIVGRLKVLASGQAEIARDTAVHYTDLLANLHQHPEWLLFDTAFMDAQRAPHEIAGGVVEDPIDYLGGALRHTSRRDPRLHAACSLLVSVEALARRHGELLDTIAEARQQTDQRDRGIHQVL